jgi:hypothetical protein
VTDSGLLLKSFGNNLEILCHPICDRLYFGSHYQPKFSVSNRIWGITPGNWAEILRAQNLG